jgi:hypothetical protein
LFEPAWLPEPKLDPLGCFAPALAGCTRAGGVVVRCTGRAAGWTGLAAGLAAGWAGLEGAGAPVFFWSPQASAEKIIRTKITVDFLMIPLFSMFKLLMISCSSESFLCDFTIDNGGKLQIPQNSVDRSESSISAAPRRIHWSVSRHDQEAPA